MARGPQLRLDLPPRFGWGGARAGSGRKPRGEEPGISHERVIEVNGRSPVHVALRARSHVWNLRSVRCHAIVATALRGVLGRRGFRVDHFSIQGNHLHLIVEADDATALASGMKSISGRIAKGLNRLMQRKGRVFADRYHAHVLRTPAEVRNAIDYVLGNFASHAERRGERLDASYVDPYSSAAARGPDSLAPPVSPPRTWLLATHGTMAREGEAVYVAAAYGCPALFRKPRFDGGEKGFEPAGSRWRKRPTTHAKPRNAAVAQRFPAFPVSTLVVVS